jgi:hypothetical protein
LRVYLSAIPPDHVPCQRYQPEWVPKEGTLLFKQIWRRHVEAEATRLRRSKKKVQSKVPSPSTKELMAAHLNDGDFGGALQGGRFDIRVGRSSEQRWLNTKSSAWRSFVASVWSLNECHLASLPTPPFIPRRHAVA